MFVSHSSEAHGAERSLVEFANSLAAHGWNVTVVLPKEGPLQLQFNAAVRTYVVPMAWWDGRDRRLAARLRRALRNLIAIPHVAVLVRRRADVVVSNTAAVPVGALAAKLAQRRHLWYLHEFGPEDHAMYFDLGVRRTARVIWRLSDVVLANSEQVGSLWAERAGSPPPPILEYAIEVDTPYSSSTGAALDQQLRAVMVGRLAPGKGQEDALRAVAEVSGRGVDIHLQIVGGGPDEERRRLEQLVDSLCIRHLVEFTGHVVDASPFQRCSDIALVCSRAEGFGRVTVEAMKFGCCVIGSTGGTTSELVDHGVTGLLYDADEPGELADRLHDLALHPERAVQLGRAGQAWALDRFSIDRARQGMESHLIAALS